MRDAGDLLRSLAAELLKIRRTRALLIALVAPYLVALLPFVVALSQGGTLARRPAFSPWIWLAGAAFSTWTLILFPLFLSLEAALLAATEHRSHGFKHLFALPVRRGALYGAKQIAVALLTAASLLLLVLGLVAAGLALRELRPGLGFEAPVPWSDLLVCAGRIFAASGLVLAVHTWMSLRFRSFAPVLALGILATVVTIALNSGDVEVWPWFPWSLPFRAARGFGQAVHEPALLALGALGGLAAAVFAGWEMTRRDVF
jgi:lantibiotic transport system permease protein